MDWARSYKWRRRENLCTGFDAGGEAWVWKIWACKVGGGVWACEGRWVDEVCRSDLQIGTDCGGSAIYSVFKHHWAFEATEVSRCFDYRDMFGRELYILGNGILTWIYHVLGAEPIVFFEPSS